MDSLWSLDIELYRLIHVDLRREWLDPVFHALSLSGLGHVVLIALLILMAFKPLRRHSAACLAGGLISVVFSSIFKQVIDRPRPSNLDFSVPIEKVFNSESFPSGHTTQTLGVALTALWLTRNTEYAWVGWVATTWAALSSFSRIYVGVHWPTDVLGGLACALIGSSLAWLWLGEWVVAEAGLEPAT